MSLASSLTCFSHHLYLRTACMAETIKVIVVDDAVVVRTLLLRVLSTDPAIDVVDVAENGRVGIEKIAKHAPDLVVLDLEMPEMNGLAAMRVIRKRWPKLPVIVFSGHAEDAGRVTIEAMAAGATDYILKPDGGRGSRIHEVLKGQLIPMIRAICGRHPAALTAPLAALPKSTTARRPGVKFEVLAIAASTGGPMALDQIVRELPSDFPIPVVIVQHMPAGFTRHFSERMNTHTLLNVREGVQGPPLKAGDVWVAPGGFHMVLQTDERGPQLALNRDEAENSCRPAADPLFRSVAKLYGDKALVVVLTGMGRDALAGCNAISEAGGHILVQDQKSSAVWGMPGEVASAGLAAEILPLDRMAATIARLCSKPSAALGRPTG
ncbi:MAG: two-component system chemotaxis response regulator CheB [Planctomycetota bacterium]|jgi:two-component system chemotaxis response regulator CheB